jgi:hypothetical protein
VHLVYIKGENINIHVCICFLFRGVILTLTVKADNFDTTRHEHDTKLAGLDHKRVYPFILVLRVGSHVTRR